eukprot:XP_766369.1 hypothetical protein [Theileria parva strain Muguga]
MEIPPFIRITPNILTKFRYNNNIYFKPLNNNDKLDSLIINNTKTTSNESIKPIDYNLNDLVDTISGYLNKSNVSSYGLLEYNLDRLEKRNYDTKKIGNKLMRILNYRILSLFDKLNTNQLSKLIFSLTHSNEKFSDLTLKLLELFLEKSKFNAVPSDDNDVYDHFLVLSSFLIFKNKCNNEIIENKLIDNINLINFNPLNFNNGVLLQFLNTLTFLNNHEKLDENVIEQIFYKLNVEKMAFNEMCTLIHTYSLLQSNVTYKAQHIMEVEIILKRNITFQFSNDFYRVTFPITLSNLITQDYVGKWILEQLINNYDNYVKQLSNFLFILMRVASSVKIEHNKVTNGVKGAMVESLYEEALMYLNEKGDYLPTNRSKLLYLFDKIVEFIQSADSDQFIQV